MSAGYERDLSGYGEHPPNAEWPDQARIAVQFVVNYEEGGENCLLHGDPASEAFLSEIVGVQPFHGQRHWNMESIYEYGARAGFWRLKRLFDEQAIPVTVFGVATALARSPDQVFAMQQSGWEIASHGYKWIEYKDFTPDQEREHIQKAIDLHYAVTGAYPEGWYTGRCSAHTLALCAELYDFTYLADSYADDLPYWLETPSGEQLIVPYTLDVNDMRFATPQGFNTGDHFYQYLKDSFDVLYAEGEAGRAKMMLVGLHCRLVGRPGRIQALRKFIEYVQQFEGVWFARRVDIARHWRQKHPYRPITLRPSTMSKSSFVDHFGGVFEHSAWIAEAAFETSLSGNWDSAIAVHSLLCRVFRTSSREKRLGVLKAHPDLAGKLATAKMLTAESESEQASAGLDRLTVQEKETFTQLNARYVEKFCFPFIIAVKGLDKQDILRAFERRLNNDLQQEFETASQQVERIALLRLCAMFGVDLPAPHPPASGTFHETTESGG